MTREIKRFYILDILRGLAALSIVIWHWKHFFYHGVIEDAASQTDKVNYPLYFMFSQAYEQGWRAVSLFFAISGFIFFWLYSKRIADRQIGFGKYLMLRVSRLYPLHILTLLLVIFLQLWFSRVGGSYFVFPDNSLLSFVPNLTLTFNWFSSGYSFNGPVWSVSVEMLMYMIFFLFCYLGMNKWYFAVLPIVIGFMLRDTSMHNAGSGMMYFFAGGIAFYLYDWLSENLAEGWRVLIGTLVLPAVLGAAALWNFGLHRDLPVFFYYGLFLSIVLSVALVEGAVGPGIGRKFAFIGDISYSSYLWHFPLQILFVIFSDLNGFERAIYYSPALLALFYAVLIIISLVSYHYFEYPVQNYIRKKWQSEPLPVLQT